MPVSEAGVLGRDLRAHCGTTARLALCLAPGRSQVSAYLGACTRRERIGNVSGDRAPFDALAGGSEPTQAWRISRIPSGRSLRAPESSRRDRSPARTLRSLSSSLSPAGDLPIPAIRSPRPTLALGRAVSLLPAQRRSQQRSRARRQLSRGLDGNGSAEIEPGRTRWRMPEGWIDRDACCRVGPMHARGRFVRAGHAWTGSPGESGCVSQRAGDRDAE